MNVTRRDLLKLAAGGVAGTLLSPIPWKLLRDSAVWTQNWSWTPVPLRGDLSTRHTACPLCPAACGARARCVGNRPVSLSGVPGDPVGAALCGVGLGAHHLAFHPRRLDGPRKRQGDGRFAPISLDDAVAQIAAAIRVAPAAVGFLDARPGRAISSAYASLAEALGGSVLAPPGASRSSLAILRGLFAADPGPLAWDLAGTKRIVGFGAPILDGWGGPDLVRRAADGDLRVTQVEARQSRTAIQADRWVPVLPGTEGVVALGVAHLLLRGGAADPAFAGEGSDVAGYLEAVGACTPARVKALSGVDAAALQALADDLSSPGPVIVVGGGDPGGGPLPREDEVAIQALNLLLGAVGRPGGIVARKAAPGAVPRDLEDLPEGGLRVLFVDAAPSGEALPWARVASRLAPGALVVSLSPVMADAALHAGLVVPGPAPLTAVQDLPGDADLARESLRLAVPLWPAQPGATDPLTLLARVATAAGVAWAPPADSTAALIDRRLDDLHAAGRGAVWSPADGSTVEVKDLGTAADFRDLLSRGGCWTRRDVVLAPPPPARIAAPVAWAREPAPVPTMDHPLTLLVTGWRGRMALASTSPIVAKVDQESALRPYAREVRLNPGTLHAARLRSGREALLQTPAAALPVSLRADSTVPPGCVLLDVSPPVYPAPGGDDPLALLAVPGRPTWRLCEARIREVG